MADCPSKNIICVKPSGLMYAWVQPQAWEKHTCGVFRGVFEAP